MKFSDIIGQQALKRHLAESVDRGRISHAQLFTGAAGTGALPPVSYTHLTLPTNTDV